MICTNAVRKSLFSSATQTGGAAIKLSWLDLRGSGLSVIERLCLEEALLRHDPKERNWAIVGTHEPLDHRHLSPRGNYLPDYVSKRVGEEGSNTPCIIVMGIGGKPNNLLNIDLVKQDGVAVVKRFSGGGTVVLDPSSIWTTFIGRTKDFAHIEPYPRAIMKWSADSIFGPAFQQLQQHQLQEQQKLTADTDKHMDIQRGQKTLVLDSKSCGSSEVTGSIIRIPYDRNKNLASSSRPTLLASAGNSKEDGTPPLLPDFSLRENDYTLGERKIGGNAQTIVKGSWLHHTSFLWDYDVGNMAYLTLPQKRPDYRGGRSHDDFLIKLNTYFGGSGGNGSSNGITSNRPFFAAIKTACGKEFQVEDVKVKEAMAVINRLGGMDAWFGKSRTRILTDF
jgi:lipoate-protein ligase A